MFLLKREIADWLVPRGLHGVGVNPVQALADWSLPTTTSRCGRVPPNVNKREEREE